MVHACAVQEYVTVLAGIACAAFACAAIVVTELSPVQTLLSTVMPMLHTAASNYGAAFAWCASNMLLSVSHVKVIGQKA
jgi:hypothetical protein